MGNVDNKRAYLYNINKRECVYGAAGFEIIKEDDTK